MQVRQDRALRFDPGDPFQRLMEMEMAWMRRSSQCIDDPDVEARPRRRALGRKTLNISGRGDIAKAEPERGDVAVVLQDGQEFDRASLPLDRDHLAGHQALFRDDRGVFYGPPPT